MVKIKKSSDKLNSFLSHVYISPEHATSFKGLDKLYHTVKNQFPSLTRKEIRKWTESNLSYSLHKSSRGPSNKTRCMLLKLNVFTPENRPHHSSVELQPYTEKLNTH